MPPYPPCLHCLVICWASLFWFGVGAEARQKCSLQAHIAQAVLQPPSGTGDSGSTPTLTASASSSTSISTSTSSSTDLPAATPFNYGTDKIRGVNLGGWLVLEPWITPSVFESTGNDNVVDEYTMGQLLASDDALNLLTKHWDTWITEDDFIAIKAAGLNHVRIPLGYWSVPLTAQDTNTSTSIAPYTAGAWPYFLRGLNWARKHGVHVIVDIHGAPGSQNGYDNSGQRTNNPVWASNPDNVTRTLDTLGYVMRQAGGLIDVIELLNEPAGFRGSDWSSTIRQFWLDGYDTVKGVIESGVNVMIGDAFLGVDSWTNFLTNSGVLMDFHEYQLFSDGELNRTWQQHIDFACGYVSSLSSFSSSNIWTVVGEWSNAVTDCAQWLNGRGVGARWDNTYPQISTSQYHGSCSNYTGSYSGFSDDYMTFLRMYWEVQIEVGETIQGWVFWTWKAENADEWSYQRGLEGGWIPQDPTDRLYLNICSGSS
ncbi:glycoside hydrolase family 5 protein [Cyathus striatus]|nr:glycoside hydrolase family 5 protein [Cyathus striatus]